MENTIGSPLEGIRVEVVPPASDSVVEMVIGVVESPEAAFASASSAAVDLVHGHASVCVL
jgi:hypothetical protein